MSFSKQILRAEYKALRSQLSLPQQHQYLQHMMAQLDMLQWPDVRLAMSYRADESRHEVPVHYLEEALTAWLPQVRWCYPVTQAADNSMQAMLVNDDTEWAASKFGIPEPVHGQVVAPASLQLILVPLLCFDEKGYRVGYGKGFYDRFLKHCHPQVVTLGFSWFEPVKAIADIDANDVPLKYCITPHRLYAF
ncbi:MAG: 5-formyltetrahydrofolate cyclo-ligase [Chitinophagaceae bacterium]|nr:5-formyltetrahydrofolate cyclo-ligase [Chitinophagaceae bacterium]